MQQMYEQYMPEVSQWPTKTIVQSTRHPVMRGRRIERNNPTHNYFFSARSRTNFFMYAITHQVCCVPTHPKKARGYKNDLWVHTLNLGCVCTTSQVRRTVLTFAVVPCMAEQ